MARAGTVQQNNRQNRTPYSQPSNIFKSVVHKFFCEHIANNLLIDRLEYRAIFKAAITRVVISGTSSKKSQWIFVPSTHPGTRELVLSTAKQ